MTTRNRKLTEPLETTAAVFGSLFAAVLMRGAGATLVATGTLGGLGHALVCATERNVSGGSGASSFTGVYAARPGTALQPQGAPLSVCAIHPGFGQHLLYSLMTIPQILLWGGILLLLWRLLVIARRGGPFTVRVAAAMRVLGWYIVAGSVLAAAIEQLATVLLLGSLVAPRPEGIGSGAGPGVRPLGPGLGFAGGRRGHLCEYL